jgi:hypothetical protein
MSVATAAAQTLSRNKYLIAYWGCLPHVDAIAIDILIPAVSPLHRFLYHGCPVEDEHLVFFWWAS